MKRAADANALALDEHAVEIAAQGPSSAKRSRTYSAIEDVLWVCR